jgi:endoglucanase
MNPQFLEHLLQATGPTGFEQPAIQVWTNQARTFADKVETDKHGNAYAFINPGASPKLMLAGHADEIGVMVSYIDEDGFIWLKGLGGWDAQVLVGQRIRFQGPKGQVRGVIGRKAIHLLDAEEREKAVKLRSLWADIGAANEKEAKEWLEVGSIGVIDQPYHQLLGHRVISKAIDNRIGAYIVLEALRTAKSAGVKTQVVAVATVQEEIGAYGARTAAYRLEPDTALVVDVTHCSASPKMEKKSVGEGALGKGAVLDVGPFVHPKVLARLRELAKEHHLPYELHAHTSHSGTDADEVALVREGIPTAVVSIPNRYMHSPSEMIDLDDADTIVKLLALYAGNPAEDLAK